MSQSLSCLKGAIVLPLELWHIQRRLVHVHCLSISVVSLCCMLSLFRDLAELALHSRLFVPRPCQHHPRRSPGPFWPSFQLERFIFGSHAWVRFEQIMREQLQKWCVLTEPCGEAQATTIATARWAAHQCE